MDSQPNERKQFCDGDHVYLKAPIEGWRGIKDGKLMIEGQDDVDFGDFLTNVRDVLCREAWDRFWAGM
jgi:hypothetical protein